MHLLVWIMVGIVTGWVTRKALAEDGYSAIVNNTVAIAGALSGGLILQFTDTAAQKQFVHTSLAAFLGAAIFTAFTTIIIGRGRLV